MFRITWHNRSCPPTLVAPGQTILEAALDDGVPISFGCFYGQCTACMSRLIEGEVSQEQAYALRDEDRDAGWVLLCVATPLSDCVVFVGVDDLPFAQKIP